MIARAGSGWQTVLADLSLILFMVTGSAVSSAGAARGEAQAPSPTGEPLALWRAGAGAPPLGAWLAVQGTDPRQQLTIVARYAPGGLAGAIGAADTLAREAGKAGYSARVVIEPGDPGTVATLAYDAPGAALARNLLDTRD